MTEAGGHPKRYQRQELLPEIGAEGQARLGRSHALVVGVGALGCVSAAWLVRAGVGTVTLVDRDIVEVGNLHRQTLFAEDDAGVPKAVAAAERLTRANSGVRIRAIVADVNGATIGRLHRRGLERVFGGGSRDETGERRFDVIVDGTDNYETRYLLNDYAVREGVAYCYGGVVGTEGVATTVIPRGDGRTPCIRCLFPDVPAAGTMATCETAGVLGPAVGLVASWQAVEALKVLVGDEGAVHRALARFAPWGGGVTLVGTAGARDAGCVCCGEGRYEFLERKETGVSTMCGRGSVQVLARGEMTVDLDVLGARLAKVGRVERTEHYMKVVLEGERAEVGDEVSVTVFPDARAIVTGVTGAERAKSLYARMVGS